MLHSFWKAGFGFALILWAGLSGCATRGPASSPDDLWAAYEKAVQNSRTPQPSAISTGLVPIVRSTPGLRWDDQGRVLMVTWTKKEFYESFVGKPYTFTHGEVWLTAVPFGQRFCRSLRLPPDRLELRLKQLLGLPPDDSADAFVQMWVDPKDFFRPCADPEITDRECTLNFTTNGPPESGCPWAASFDGQTSARWVSATREHFDWMCGNWSKSFDAEPKERYPWTGLGYTYDWGRPERPVGQSEFVAPQGTTVLIESVTETASYCRPE